MDAKEEQKARNNEENEERKIFDAILKLQTPEISPKRRPLYLK